MQIRTIRECVEMLHADDPESTKQITENGLRMLVKKGEIPCRRIGRKVLLNYDIVKTYFTMSD